MRGGGASPDWLALAGRLNQLSLLPFLAFLWALWRTPGAPRRVVSGFTAYLAFIVVAVPAGIWSRAHLGTSMANVDWIHGPCEALLTAANLLIVLGLRGAIREAEARPPPQPGSGQGAEPGAGSGAAGEPAAAAAAAAAAARDALADIHYMQELHKLYSAKHSGGGGGGGCEVAAGARLPLGAEQAGAAEAPRRAVSALPARLRRAARPQPRLPLGAPLARGRRAAVGAAAGSGRIVGAA